MNNLYDIAIVGGGPAGIASAVESVLLGVSNIVLFEKGDNHSMTIRKFYKDNKRVDKDWKGQKMELHGNVIFTDGTKESTIDLFNQLIDDHDIDARFNTEIESIKKYDDVFIIRTNNNVNFKAKNVIISIGKMGKPNKPSYKIPLSIRNMVNFNLDKCSQGEKVLVVGGGNSASEYAYYLGDSNDVTLNYRKDKFTRLNPENINMIDKYISENKLKLKMGVDVASLDSEECKVRVNFTDGSCEIFDRVIYAIGGVLPVDFLRSCSVEVDEKTRPEIDKFYQTKVKGLYVAGDLAESIGGSIAMSLNHAYTIVNHIKEIHL